MRRSDKLAQFRFSRESRLLRPSEFRHIFASNPARHAFRGVVVWASPQREASPRLGITVPKRFFPLSVTRNQIRRWVRESFRHEQARLAGWDIIVQVRRWDCREQTSQDFYEVMQTLWKRLSVPLSVSQSA